jgi:hypothetical protein
MPQKINALYINSERFVILNLKNKLAPTENLQPFISLKNEFVTV